VRYLPNGTLDAAFGADGKVITDFGDDEEARALVLQTDGKLVAAGGRGLGVVSDFVLARYDSVGGGEGVPIGGKGLGITPRTSIDLTWTGGEQQLAYLMTRSPTASAVLPDRTTTLFHDVAPAYDRNLNCYALFPLGSSGPLGVSDLLCAQLGLRSPARSPGDFTLRLNQSTTASLSWSAPGGELGYELLAVPVDGRNPYVFERPPGATFATDATSGSFTCYQLHAIYSDGLAQTDVVCGLPGVSAFPLPAATAPQTAASPQVQAAATGQQQLSNLFQAGKRQVEQEAGKLRRKGR